MIRLSGLALFAGSILLFEIGLTRLFATIYYPPTVFAVLSLGVLGIGLGAAAAAWQQRWREVDQLPLYAGGPAITGILLIATLLTGQALVPPALRGLWIYLVLIPLPFFFAGLFLATLFGQQAQDAPRLYMADLVGAGLGALAVVPLFQWLGVVNGLRMALVGVVAGGWLIHCSFERRIRTRSNFYLGAILLLTLAPAGYWPDSYESNLFQQKPLGEQLQEGASLLASRWDAFARTDLIDPGDGRPYELYIDGAAGSVMPPAEGDPALWKDIGLFPFATEQPKRVFLIGPGGGLDIWFALQGRAEEIVAAEVNPGSVAIVREFGDYNGDLYGNSPYGNSGTGIVTLRTEDGRSLLERESESYDLIFLSQVVTLAAERAGFALTENHVYTVEAMQTYLDRLTESGQVAFKLYDEVTLTRALVTAVTALEENGLSEQEALNHIMVLLDPNADPAIPLLMVRNSPYSRDDVLSIAAVAEQVGFRPLFLPGVLAEPPLLDILNGAKTLAEVIGEAENAIGPTVDDRPFFFHFERGLDSNLSGLVWGALGLTIMVLLLPTLLASTRRKGGRFRSGIYFSGLGLGFMFVEIALIQQTQLVLGHPTLSISAVLATLLIGGGVGSGFWHPQKRLPTIPLIGIVLGIGIWWLGWPLIQQALLQAEWWLRLVSVVLCILPLAFMMGIPFPIGLKRLADDSSAVALAWSINGVMSVVAAVLGLAIAQLWGFSYLMVIGGAAYFVVWAISVVGVQTQKRSDI